MEEILHKIMCVAVCGVLQRICRCISYDPKMCEGIDKSFFLNRSPSLLYRRADQGQRRKKKKNRTNL